MKNINAHFLCMTLNLAEGLEVSNLESYGDVI